MAAPPRRSNDVGQLVHSEGCAGVTPTRSKEEQHG